MTSDFEVFEMYLDMQMSFLNAAPLYCAWLWCVLMQHCVVVC